MKTLKENLVLLLITILILTAITSAEQPIKNTQVTVYNENLGLIRQTRTLDLKKGVSEIRLEEVAAKIDPTSVRLTFPKLTGKIKILEQKFLYDLVSPQKIFENYIGEFICYRLENGDEFVGRLLDTDGKNIVLELPDGGLRIASTKTIVDYEFPSLPEGLILKPTLQWILESKRSGSTEAELSYLTAGMSWHAEYVMIIEKNDRDFSLISRVSLDNKSGATYKNAKTKLVAGKIHRAPALRRVLPHGEPVVALASAKGEAFKERELFEYHLYELQRPITIKDKEIKQVTLFDEIFASCEKVYTFKNNAYSESEKPLTVEIRVANISSNNLGIPLPEGVIRVFKKDIDKSLQLIGEDRIAHTSKNDTISIDIGQAFEVKGKRIIKDKTSQNNRSETVTTEICISNKRSENIYVEVHEFHRGNWYVKRASHPYTMKSSSLLIFSLRIPANDKATITYTFQRTW